MYRLRTSGQVDKDTCIACKQVDKETSIACGQVDKETCIACRQVGTEACIAFPITFRISRGNTMYESDLLTSEPQICI